MIMIGDVGSIFELLEFFPNEQSCIDFLELIRWKDNVISPFDSTSKVYKCKNNRYKCHNTNRYFNVKTGTIFESTKLPLRKWFMALFLFSSHKKGISSHQLAKDINVTQQTAWFLLHRLRHAFNVGGVFLSNKVEVDETYIGGAEKNKHFDKKEKSTQGRSLKKKSAVFGMIERNGNIIAMQVNSVSKRTLQKIILTKIIVKSTIFTDEWKAYRGLKNDYEHFIVKHSTKEYVNGDAHTNNMECFWSHLKRGIKGMYHSVSKKHLQRYIDEFVLRYNTRNNGTFERFNLILFNINDKLSYKQLINQ